MIDLGPPVTLARSTRGLNRQINQFKKDLEAHKIPWMELTTGHNHKHQLINLSQEMGSEYVAGILWKISACSVGCHIYTYRSMDERIDMLRLDSNLYGYLKKSPINLDFSMLKLFIDVPGYGYETSSVDFHISAVYTSREQLVYSTCMSGSIDGLPKVLEDFEDLLVQRVDLPEEYNCLYDLSWENLLKLHRMVDAGPTNLKQRTVRNNYHNGLLVSRAQ